MVILANKKLKSQSIQYTMDYDWTPGQETTNNQDVGVPRAIFMPHSNSLSFDERRVTLEQPVKVNMHIYHI